MNEEWNDSLNGHYLWSNTNFGEAVTAVMTPLTWSVIQFTLADWVFLPGYPTVGNIGGYPYLNISVFATVFRAMGRGQENLLAEMESTVYMQLPAGLDIPLIEIPLGKRISGWAKALQVQTRQARGLRALKTYLEENERWFQRVRAQLNTADDRASLYGLWGRQLKGHIQRGAWCVLGSVAHSTNYTMALRRDLAGLVGPDQANVLIANLNDPADPLQSLGPVAGLARVAGGELTQDAYLDQFGHRGPHEFELAASRPAEDPTWLEQELATFKANPVDVEAMLARQRAAFETAWSEFAGRYPRKAVAMRRRIAESARRARDRELARSAYIRDRWSVRLFALRAGELTGLGQDIFFLRLEEILDLLNGGDMPGSRIADRQAAYHKYKNLPPYPSLILGPFDPAGWAADPQRRADIYAPGLAQERVKKTRLTGSPGSAGQVEGYARILSGPEQGGDLRPGEILVAVQTDIAWTMIFPRAAAVITDVGAPLSHAAIVARELGIPAVVGCGDATQRLKTGDRVRVDGARGVVEILDTR